MSSLFDSEFDEHQAVAAATRRNLVFKPALWKDIQAKLTAEKGRAAVLAADEKRTDEAKVGELYLWAFSRPAESSEVSTAKDHIEKKVTKAADADAKKKAKREAYEDIVWALISSKEFLFNH